MNLAYFVINLRTSISPHARAVSSVKKGVTQSKDIYFN